MFLRLNGGRLNYLKLLKLLYLTERECLRIDGNTITGDCFRALRNGPILSTVYNLIKGKDSQSPRWNRYIKQGTDYYVFIAEDPGTEDLYRFEKELIQKIDEEYKDAGEFDLVRLTHTFPEWKKFESRLLAPGFPNSYSITLEDILEGINKLEMIQPVLDNLYLERFYHELVRK